MIIICSDNRRRSRGIKGKPRVANVWRIYRDRRQTAVREPHRPWNLVSRLIICVRWKVKRYRFLLVLSRLSTQERAPVNFLFMPLLFYRTAPPLTLTMVTIFFGDGNGGWRPIHFFLSIELHKFREWVKKNIPRVSSNCLEQSSAGPEWVESDRLLWHVSGSRTRPKIEMQMSQDRLLPRRAL